MRGGTEVLLCHTASVPIRPQCSHKTVMSSNSNLLPSLINQLVTEAKEENLHVEISIWILSSLFEYQTGARIYL